jgi:hypothetical protein
MAKARRGRRRWRRRSKGGGDGGGAERAAAMAKVRQGRRQWQKRSEGGGFDGRNWWSVLKLRGGNLPAYLKMQLGRHYSWKIIE